MNFELKIKIELKFFKNIWCLNKNIKIEFDFLLKKFDFCKTKKSNWILKKYLILIKKIIIDLLFLKKIWFLEEKNKFNWNSKKIFNF